MNVEKLEPWISFMKKAFKLPRSTLARIANRHHLHISDPNSHVSNSRRIIPNFCSRLTFPTSRPHYSLHQLVTDHFH